MPRACASAPRSDSRSRPRDRSPDLARHRGRPIVVLARRVRSVLDVAPDERAHADGTGPSDRVHPRGGDPDHLALDESHRLLVAHA